VDATSDAVETTALFAAVDIGSISSIQTLN
jgi:hypothetical protein